MEHISIDSNTQTSRKLFHQLFDDGSQSFVACTILIKRTIHAQHGNTTQSFSKDIQSQRRTNGRIDGLTDDYIRQRHSTIYCRTLSAQIELRHAIKLIFYYSATFCHPVLILNLHLSRMHMRPIARRSVSVEILWQGKCDFAHFY